MPAARYSTSDLMSRNLRKNFIYSEIEEAQAKLNIHSDRITEQENKKICQTIAENVRYKIQLSIKTHGKNFMEGVLERIVITTFEDIIKNLGSHQHVYDMCASIFTGLKNSADTNLLQSACQMINRCYASSFDLAKLNKVIKPLKDATTSSTNNRLIQDGTTNVAAETKKSLAEITRSVKPSEALYNSQEKSEKFDTQADPTPNLTIRAIRSNFISNVIKEAQEQLNIESNNFTEQQSKKICEVIVSNIACDIQSSMDTHEKKLLPGALERIVMTTFQDVIEDLGSHQHVYNMCASIFNGLKNAEDSSLLDSTYNFLFRCTTSWVNKPVDLSQLKQAINYATELNSYNSESLPLDTNIDCFGMNFECSVF